MLTVDPEAVDRDRLTPAIGALRRGELVAFPTETVYGLGADALNAEAVGRIFEAKERPPGHPLIVHVADAAGARELAADWPPAAAKLAAAFWPGPLTVIVEKSDHVPSIVTGGLSTVGLRVPDHPVARALLERSGMAIAAPSANPHKRVSPTRAEHVRRGLGDRVAVIVDGGPTNLGIESTVVRVDGDRATILRPGMISRSEIAEVVGRVDAPAEAPRQPEEARPSPGRADKHSAPAGRVRLLERETIAERLVGKRPAGRLGLLTIGDLPDSTGGDRLARVEALPADPSGYGGQLYEALHRLDEAGCDEIWIEVPPGGEAWEAIRDRVRRAAG